MARGRSLEHVALCDKAETRFIPERRHHLTAAGHLARIADVPRARRALACAVARVAKRTYVVNTAGRTLQGLLIGACLVGPVAEVEHVALTDVRLAARRSRGSD